MRARQAAAASMSAAAAPAVASPASAPVARAIASLARPWRSRIWTQAPDASAIAAATSGRMGFPDKRVEGPAAFTMTGTPRRS